MRHIGLDLGTSYCKLAEAKEDFSTDILDIYDMTADGERVVKMLPSYLTYNVNNGRTESLNCCGTLAKEKFVGPVETGTRTFQSDKPNLERFRDYGGNDPERNLDELLSRILSPLNVTGDNACLTLSVPPLFSNSARTKLLSILARHNFRTNSFLMDEPTAALLNYLYGKNHAEALELFAKEKNVLVLDMGGGTTDAIITRVSLINGKLEIKPLSTASPCYVAGDMFDEEVAKWMYDEYKRQFLDEGFLQDYPTYESGRGTFLGAAERYKLHVAESDQDFDPEIPAYDKENLYYGMDWESCLYPEAIQNLLSSDSRHGFLWSVVDALNKAGLTRHDIDVILLNGQMCRLPIIAEVVEEFFCKKPKIQSVDDLTFGVARGAAIYSSLKAKGGLEVLRKLSNDVKITLYNSENHPVPVEIVGPHEGTYPTPERSLGFDLFPSSATHLFLQVQYGNAKSLTVCSPLATDTRYQLRYAINSNGILELKFINMGGTLPTNISFDSEVNTGDVETEDSLVRDLLDAGVQDFTDWKRLIMHTLTDNGDISKLGRLLRRHLLSMIKHHEDRDRAYRFRDELAEKLKPYRGEKYREVLGVLSELELADPLIKISNAISQEDYDHNTFCRLLLNDKVYPLLISDVKLLVKFISNKGFKAALNTTFNSSFHANRKLIFRLAYIFLICPPAELRSEAECFVGSLTITEDSTGVANKIARLIRERDRFNADRTKFVSEYNLEYFKYLVGQYGVPEQNVYGKMAFLMDEVNHKFKGHRLLEPDQYNGFGVSPAYRGKLIDALLKKHTATTISKVGKNGEGYSEAQCYTIEATHGDKRLLPTFVKIDKKYRFESELANLEKLRAMEFSWVLPTVKHSAVTYDENGRIFGGILEEDIGKFISLRDRIATECENNDFEAIAKVFNKFAKFSAQFYSLSQSLSSKKMRDFLGGNKDVASIDPLGEEITSESGMSKLDFFQFMRGFCASQVDYRDSCAHRDMHSRNILITDDSIRIVDWCGYRDAGFPVEMDFARLEAECRFRDTLFSENPEWVEKEVCAYKQLVNKDPEFDFMWRTEGDDFFVALKNSVRQIYRKVYDDSSPNFVLYYKFLIIYVLKLLARNEVKANMKKKKMLSSLFWGLVKESPEYKKYHDFTLKSKTLSYYLRQSREVANCADKNGAIPWEELRDIVRFDAGRPGRPDSNRSQLANLSWDELRALVKEMSALFGDDRFECAVKDGKHMVRAVYGHSSEFEIEYKIKSKLPEYLYHVTDEKNLKAILKDGIVQMKRSKVHLFTSKDFAQNKLLRQKTPKVLRVSTAKCCERGVRFYQASSRICLADRIPIDCFKVEA